MAVTVPSPRMPPDVPDALVVSVVVFMPEVPDGLVTPVVLFIPVALRVVSAALGEVRTTVAVSLRGTAFRLASAAVCGVTPTEVVGWLAPAAGMVLVPVVPLVWARATELPATSAVISKSWVLVKVFMVKISPVGLERTAAFQSMQDW